ncbi:MAG: flagellar basal body-associated FliL family protein [Planctomycetota bacterium]|nr:flagellar basal body-associated FliL family protein [Planctomycetota bacterium]
MAEDQPPTAAKAEAVAAPPAPSFLSGTRAWIILIAAVGVEAIFFSALLYLKDKQKAKTAPETAAGAVSEDAVYSHYFAIKDLTYSIPTPPTGTATLTMEIGIRLGRTEEEKQKGEDLTEAEWAQFDAAVRSLEPAIRDKLTSHIYQQTINELSSPNGREKIKDIVKDFVNGELEKMNILKERKTPYAKRRVAAVLIPMYYLQQ